MDVPTTTVISIMSGIVTALSTAVVFLYRDLGKKNDELARRNERLETELDEERTARREAAEAIAKSSVEIIQKQGQIAEVLNRQSEANRRGGIR